MKITRNTIRADGLTVGEALDRDAAFLRSIGIDAKDGAKTYDEKLDDFRDKLRKAALDAMDVVCEEIGQKGPLDAELDKLFKGVDPIADRALNASLGL